MIFLRCYLFTEEMQIFFMKLGIYIYIDASFFPLFLRGKCLFEQETAVAVTSYFNEINLYLQFAVI